MDTENSIQPLTDALTVVAEAYSPLTPPRSVSEHYIESAGKLAEIMLQTPTEYHQPLGYHQARLLALGDNVDEAVAVLDEFLERRTPLPEAIWLKIHLCQ